MSGEKEKVLQSPDEQRQLSYLLESDIAKVIETYSQQGTVAAVSAFGAIIRNLGELIRNNGKTMPAQELAHVEQELGKLFVLLKAVRVLKEKSGSPLAR